MAKKKFKVGDSVQVPYKGGVYGARVKSITGRKVEVKINEGPHANTIITVNAD